jgi:hypothetical protein
MTISSTARKAGPFSGTGAQTAFPFTFKVFATTDVLVVLTDSTGAETTLSVGYSVSLNADQNASPGGTVNLVTAPPIGSLITIGSVVPTTQTSSIPNQGGFYPKVIENALDKLTVLIQQIAGLANRSLKFPFSDTVVADLPTAMQRANNLLGFDSHGNPIAVVPNAQSAAALQALLATNGGAVLVGHDGTTVADELDTLSEKLAFGTGGLVASFFQNSSSALFLYTSRDGVTFDPLIINAVYTLAGRALRDPCIMYLNGYWWCAYSNVPSNVDFTTTYFGVAKSQDLINWTHAFDVDTGITNTWAPEWFVDTNGAVYVLMALNYVTYLIPVNLTAGTASAPVSLGIPGQSIDGTIQYDAGTYYLFIKNETTKYIERYTASSPFGPWTKTGTGDWAGWGANVEGPSLARMIDGTWRIYFDGYLAGKYYTSTASSLASNSWSAKVEISQSGVVRHGTVVRMTEMVQQVSVLAARSGGGVGASYLLDGTNTRTAQSITAQATAPMGSAWQRYRTDADTAVFQSRRIADLSGIDFVDRPTLNYASFEILDATGNLVAVPIKIWGTSKNYRIQFPQGVFTEDWQNPGFQNSWGNGSVPMQYKANSEGMVKFAGIVAGGATGSGTVIFQLPVGWRPERTVVFPVVSNDTALGTVGVTTAGNVVYLSGGNVKLDLSSISFYVR